MSVGIDILIDRLKDDFTDELFLDLTRTEMAVTDVQEFGIFLNKYKFFLADTSVVIAGDAILTIDSDLNEVSGTIESVELNTFFIAVMDSALDVSDSHTIYLSITPDRPYQSYGRAFVNQRDGQPIPEVMTAGTTEYSEVKLDDTKAALSYFVVDGQYDVRGDAYTAEVVIYFACNLPLCYTSATERAVEYLHRDVAGLIFQSDFTLNSIRDGWGDFEGAFQNMQPWYLCRFVTSVQWTMNEC